MFLCTNDTVYNIYLKFYFDPEYAEFINQYNVDDKYNLKNTEYPPEAEKPKVYYHVIAGLISGPVSRTITAPIDRLRIQTQVDPNFHSFKKTINDLYMNGGIRGFWRGNLINVLKVGPEMALRFGFFEKFKALIASNADQPLTLTEKFLSASGAGIIGALAIYPLEVLKTRLSIRKTGQYKGMFDAISQIYQKEGLIAFYRGYVVGAAGNIPYVGIDLTLFETLKLTFVYPKGKELELSHFEKMVRVMSCATVSTTVAQFCTYPFYLLKTRQQGASTHVANTIKVKWRFCQMCQIFYYIITNEGFPGLYRGILPTLVKVLPASAINYTLYDFSFHRLVYFFGK